MESDLGFHAPALELLDAIMGKLANIPLPLPSSKPFYQLRYITLLLNGNHGPSARPRKTALGVPNLAAISVEWNEHHRLANLIKTHHAHCPVTNPPHMDRRRTDLARSTPFDS